MCMNEAFLITVTACIPSPNKHRLSFLEGYLRQQMGTTWGWPGWVQASDDDSTTLTLHWYEKDLSLAEEDVECLSSCLDELKRAEVVRSFQVILSPRGQVIGGPTNVKSVN